MKVCIHCSRCRKDEVVALTERDLYTVFGVGFDDPETGLPRVYPPGACRADCDLLRDCFCQSCEDKLWRDCDDFYEGEGLRRYEAWLAAEEARFEAALQAHRAGERVWDGCL